MILTRHNGDRREHSHYKPMLVVAMLAAVPLFFALLPIFALILGTLSDFTSSLLGADSGNLALNAMSPWFAVAFIGGAGFVVVVSFLILAARLRNPEGR